MVWFGLVRFGFGLVCFGLVWFGLVWFGLVWFGLGSFHFISFRLISFHFVHFVSFRFISFHFISLVSFMVWFGLVWFGFISCHFVSVRFGSFRFVFSFRFVSFRFVQFYSIFFFSSFFLWFFLPLLSFFLSWCRFFACYSSVCVLQINGPFYRRNNMNPVHLLNWIEIGFVLIYQKKKSRRFFHGGAREIHSIMSTKKSKNTHFGLDWIEFEEVIQLDMTFSHWANAPEEIRRMFELCRRLQLRK